MKPTSPVVENTPKVQSPLTELRQCLADFASRCRTMRWLGALFHVRVASAIVTDVAHAEATAARDAYAAQQDDAEAEQEISAARVALEQALEGGLDKSDAQNVRTALNRLRAARGHVIRSGERDRRISEQFAHA